MEDLEHTQSHTCTHRYMVQEEDRKGKINAAKATALGLSPGPAYKALIEGQDVVLPDGSVIKAKDVVSPSSHGRKLTVLGDTSNPYAMAPLAMDSDVSDMVVVRVGGCCCCTEMRQRSCHLISG